MTTTAALRRIGAIIEAASYHRNYRAACIEIDGILVDLVAAAPVAGEGLDVESGMTPEARAKYRAALAANQPVAEGRT